jgi:hypothetical protein
MKPRIFFISIVVLFLCRCIAWYLFPLYDDAFITFQYASNLVQHGQFVFSLDIWVQAVTCPLYSLILTPLFLFSHFPQKIIPLLNILIECSILWLSRDLFLNQTKQSFYLIFGLMISLSPLLARVSVGGMEMPFLVLGYIFLLLAVKNRHTFIVGIPALSAIMFFIRPEASILAIISVVYLWIIHGWKKTIIPALCGLLIALIGMLIMQLVYQSPLPQSLMAKSEHISEGFTITAIQLFAPEPMSLVIHSIVFLSFIWIIYARIKLSHWMYINASWYVLYALAYVLARPSIWSWYGYPLVFMAILHIVGMVEILSHHLWIKRLETALQSKIVLVIPLVIWFGISAKSTPERITKNIYDRLQNSEYFKGNKLETIVAGDVGAIGYFTKKRIIDVNSLVWINKSQHITSASMVDIIEKEKPDYMFLNATRSQINLIQSRYIDAYQTIDRYDKDGSSISTMDSTIYPDIVWRQDYLLLKRKQQ